MIKWMLVFLLTAFFACSKTPEELLHSGIEKADKGDTSGAIKDFSDAIKLDSNYSKVYFERAKYSENPNQEFDIRKYLELETPNFVNALLSRGMLARLNNEYGTAIEYYDKAIMLNPDFIQAYGLKRDALEMSGDTMLYSQFMNSLPLHFRESIIKNKN